MPRRRLTQPTRGSSPPRRLSADLRLANSQSADSAPSPGTQPTGCMRPPVASRSCRLTRRYSFARKAGGGCHAEEDVNQLWKDAKDSRPSGANATGLLEIIDRELKTNARAYSANEI